jgi:hypothetical protein
MQVLIIATAVSPQVGIMVDMFSARAGGMMNGSDRDKVLAVLEHEESR